MYKSLELEGDTRRAFTFPLLMLLGDTISDLKLSALESQTIWTAATTAFWCSCRMGDILVNSSQSNIKKLVTWERVKSKDENQTILYFAHPKQAKRDLGQVRDIFSFPIKTYCPVDNLNTLAEMQIKAGYGGNLKHVFTLPSGSTLTMARMNQVLKHTLKSKANVSLGTISCHSFRAALPSMMASHPAIFTTEETILQGEWHGESYQLYTRLNGIGRLQTHQKVVSTFMDMIKHKVPLFLPSPSPYITFSSAPYFSLICNKG